MRVTSKGLAMALVDVDEAVNGEWRHYAHDIDVVRVQDPPAHTWPRLRDAGFLPKPQVLEWQARTCDSEEAYLAALPRKDRYDIRVSYRNAADSQLALTTEALTASALEAFLVLYEEQIGRMRHGWAVAVEQRDRILAEADTYFAVMARSCGELVGVCLSQDLTAADEVRARFSAVTAEQRTSSLARVLYWEMMREARLRGRSRVCLGRDINLYGHVGNAGLFSFKSRLGFAAVPSQRAEPSSGSHQADRVVRLAALSDPALVLSYGPADDAPAAVASALFLNVFTTDAASLDVLSYRGVELAGTAVHELKTT
ncbi:GNAT family N-acetyltransferase [Streptomyces sp. NPDC057950]|uniref:GNAT family N-acetyltransferase n=1 Tax=Streptomyces sp. NPDC057950 TaxID=3346288 RepID=UPI0036E2ABC5